MEIHGAALVVNKLMDMALSYFKTGRFQEAEETCMRVLKTHPGNLESLYLLAQIAAEQSNYEKAADIMEEICTRSTNDALYNDLYTFHAKAGRLDKAVPFFRGLVRENPECYSAWYFLGLTCLDRGDLEGARQAFFRSTRLRPDAAEAYYQLAISYEKSGYLFSAAENLQTALNANPDSHHYSNYLAGLLKFLGRADESVAYYAKAVELAPWSGSYFSNYLMNFLCTTEFSPEHVFTEHQRWAQISCTESGPPYAEFTNSPSPDRRLRIGYVSSDFYSHPVAFFIEPLITLHDRHVVDLFIYSNVEKEDYVTEQFKQRPSTWRMIHGKSELEVCHQIREDSIDILVDLGGHTKSNRLPVFAKKPAPIQVTWLGYANTTGLPTIDYRFTDSVADPPGLTERFHSEELYRLPGSFICYYPPLDPPDITPLPLLKNGRVTFVAFNNFAKVNQPLIDLWAKILRRIPEARLILKEKGLRTDNNFRTMVLDWFAERGVTADRLELTDKTPTVHAHLESLALGDIALDSYPYNGTTTTCEALWMGVPVVTLAGKVHVSRVSASLLTSVGVPELIANSEEAFIQIAVQLAEDKDRLQRYRQTLREKMLNSSLMDLEGFARKMEAAYRNIWQRWCTNRSESI